MSCCSGCRYPAAAERQFGGAVAERDLRRYRAKGPDATSRLLLTGVAPHLVVGDSLLDIGAGVGVLGFEFLSSGAGDATLVDASPAYLDAAQQEAVRRGQSDRIRCVGGDFVSIADSIEPSDVVTVHRVVCCYPDYARLLDRATEHSRRVLAVSYPRNRWFVRSFLALQNLGRRLSGSEFRIFVHPPDAMECIICRAGFRRVGRYVTVVWAIDVYRRSAASSQNHIVRG